MVLIWRDRAERVLRKRERELLRQLEGTNGLPPFGFGFGFVLFGPKWNLDFRLMLVNPFRSQS